MLLVLLWIVSRESTTKDLLRKVQGLLLLVRGLLSLVTLDQQRYISLGYPTTCRGVSVGSCGIVHLTLGDLSALPRTVSYSLLKAVLYAVYMNPLSFWMLFQLTRCLLLRGLLRGHHSWLSLLTDDTTSIRDVWGGVFIDDKLVELLGSCSLLIFNWLGDWSARGACTMISLMTSSPGWGVKLLPCGAPFFERRLPQ